MESAARAIPEVPDPADVRRRVARGRPLRISLGETVTMSEAEAAGRALQAALPPDVLVIVSSIGKVKGPSLNVLQLVTDAEAAAVRPALESLVAEFRQAAGALVTRMWDIAGPDDHDADWDYPETVRWRDTTWYLDLHGEHCRFEDEASGEVVEAQIYLPDTIDPYFLLMYAETSGRHSAVVEACSAGFHDMCRLLDLAGFTGSW